MAFKLVISDPKTRKSGQKEVSGEGLMGKKIGDNVSGSVAGLDGYELEITGGSDKDGFPMRMDVEGIGRKRILLSGATGFHSAHKGMRKRKSIRGNTISEDIVQINTKIVKHGTKPLEQVLGGAKKEEKKPEGAEGKKHEEEGHKAEHKKEEKAG